MKNKIHNKLGFALAASSLLAMSASNAALVMNFTQSGPNEVTLVTTGSANLTDLTPGGPITTGPTINSVDGHAISGQPGQVFLWGPITVPNPSPFFSTGVASPTSSSGPLVGFWPGTVRLVLPSSYLSGDSIATSTSIFTGTFASLGITPGTYVYSWGSGANADTLTLNALTAIPEPSTALLGLVGTLALFRRRRG